MSMRCWLLTPAIFTMLTLTQALLTPPSLQTYCLSYGNGDSLGYDFLHANRGTFDVMGSCNSFRKCKNEAKKRRHCNLLPSRNSALDLRDRDTDSKSLMKTCCMVFLISAPLGTLLDNYHGLFDVLKYQSIALPYRLYNPLAPDQVIVKSAAFVGPLFGLAGFFMSFLQIALDAKFDTPVQKRAPSWPHTFNSIGFFALQYYLSGLFDYAGFSNLHINIFLFVYCMIGWWSYDKSKAGFVLGVLTGL